MKLLRAHRFVAQAEAALKRSHWEEAYSKIQVAYQLTPLEPSIIRMTARLYTLAKHPQSIHFWTQLLETGEVTDQDRRTALELALVNQDQKAASLAVRHWYGRSSQVAFRLFMLARYFLSIGDIQAATDHASLCAQLRPSDVVVRMFLARLLVDASETLKQKEGLKVLWSISELQDQYGLEALELLGRRKELTPEGGEQIILRLTKHPLKRLQHELILKDLILRFRPEEYFGVIDSTMDQGKKSGAEDRLLIGRWLNKHKNYKRTVELIPLDEAVKNRDTFTLRLDALAALGLWTTIREELDYEPSPIEAVLRELFRARVAKETGDRVMAENHWRRVHIEVGATPQALKYVAQYADRIGERAQSIQAWRRVATLPGQAREAYTELVRMANRDQDTRLLRDLLREMNRLFPKEPGLLNDVTYLNLLLRENVEESRQKAEDMFREHPTQLVNRATLALAQLRLGDISAAKKAFEGISVDWTLVHPGVQAVHAAVHGASGNRAAATEFAQQIPLDRLKQEERELIQRWIE